jgi:prolyl oligopeptidase
MFCTFAQLAKSTRMKQFFIFALITFSMACTNRNISVEYPETRKDSVIDNYFGTMVEEPYRWLEDDQSEETKAWVLAQNEVTNNYLSQIPFRASIADRLRELWNYPKFSTPFKKGEYYFEYRNSGLQNQSVLYIMSEPGDSGRILLDANMLSTDGTVALNFISVSDDGKYLAYSISRGGSDWQEFRVKEIASGTDLSDHIQWVKFSGISWYGDGFFYTRYPEPKEGDALKGQNMNSKIYFHKVGSDQNDDVLYYEDSANPQWGFSAQVSDDKKDLIISVTESTSGNGLYIMNLESKKINKVVETFDVDYSVVYSEQGKYIVYTNKNAPNFALAVLQITPDGNVSWSDFVKESESVLVSCNLVGQKYFLEYLKDAHSVVNIHAMDGTFEQTLDLPLGSVSAFTGEKDDEETFFGLSSFTSPGTTYRYNIAKNELSVFRKSEIKFDESAYTTTQVFYPSKDGTLIPMFLTHKKGIKLNGANPALLYGYGGFNISITPSFSASRLILLENGGVLAVANIRGGGEYGEKWHKAGTLMQKQNVFDDFIAAAEYLINTKYTSPDKLAIQGGSNGGLLVGACMNQRPDLFAVAFPAVGVMDMLRYQKFTIGRYWATDYGTSEESKEMFEYLFAYSPLHNVKEGVDYPAIMITTGDHDDRVVPAHSFKLAATLQDKVSSKRPALIRIETNAGHGAGKPTEKIIDEHADIWAFYFHNTKVKPKYK